MISSRGLTIRHFALLRFLKLSSYSYFFSALFGVLQYLKGLIFLMFIFRKITLETFVSVFMQRIRVLGVTIQSNYSKLPLKEYYITEFLF